MNEQIRSKETIFLKSPDDVVVDVHQVMPSLTPEDFEALADSIGRRGILDPILLDEDRQVIDGHNRTIIWRNLLAEGVDIGSVMAHIIPGIDKYEAHEIAIERNLARRQLTPAQKRELVRNELIYLAEKYEAEGYVGEETRSWDSTRLARYLGVDRGLVVSERGKLEKNDVIPTAYYFVGTQTQHGKTYETTTQREGMVRSNAFVDAETPPGRPGGVSPEPSPKLREEVEKLQNRILELESEDGEETSDTNQVLLQTRINELEGELSKKEDEYQADLKKRLTKAKQEAKKQAQEATEKKLKEKLTERDKKIQAQQERLNRSGDEYRTALASVYSRFGIEEEPGILDIPADAWRAAIKEADTTQTKEVRAMLREVAANIRKLSEYPPERAAQMILASRDPESILDSTSQHLEWLNQFTASLKEMTRKGHLKAIN